MCGNPVIDFAALEAGALYEGTVFALCVSVCVLTEFFPVCNVQGLTGRIR